MPRITSCLTWLCWGILLWISSFLYVQIFPPDTPYNRMERASKAAGAGRPIPSAIDTYCDNYRVSVKESDRRCVKRLEWIQKHHLDYECFATHGLPADHTGSPCQILAYLYKIENLCVSNIPGDLRAKWDHELEVEENNNMATKIKSWDNLWKKFDKCGMPCKWMRMRLEQQQSKWDLAYKTIFGFLAFVIKY